ncbi:hypothetical protein JMM81_22230 [Bacillus sp. V3B]|uniref:hypothetical protein n=1 Tax=Bacillus sp. V3B TaxID=2804915 RepID=UPI00210E5528|nr:hypothetical protein [Bacillus sp. V3B]MCQ6277575.1 hypothetical protein [Bacillus sp. V3B]
MSKKLFFTVMTVFTLFVIPPLIYSLMTGNYKDTMVISIIFLFVFSVTFFNILKQKKKTHK